MRISTIDAAPATCHHTETLFMTAIRWPLKMFRTASQRQHDQEDHEHPGERVAAGVRLRVGADGQVDEGRAAVGDARGHRDEADQVQPPGEEAGRGAAELGRPPVDTARRRVRRDELGHREADEQDEQTQDRPGPRDRDGSAVVEAGTEVGEATGEDRDDREGDGEVGETGPRPVQVLLVAELGEHPLVVREVGRLGRFGHSEGSLRRRASWLNVAPPPKARPESLGK